MLRTTTIDLDPDWLFLRGNEMKLAKGNFSDTLKAGLLVDFRPYEFVGVQQFLMLDMKIVDFDGKPIHGNLVPNINND